ncbi:GDP-fucose synthetase [Candidatus Roizmanbacteria bacterium RIFOXYB2_FULL_41_10]|uniref:GDP-L-fucose synthase n=1 Tax=Candidatus Roizmanbacteria bacterium RIFOXYA1_FULL_41_12 TaxID=1802082 RepID=A0A1F7KAG0_9BACT|nr:MAG: GDP-fucose synthetase [Candidatus Roizmanbacteria bacterium RIFOXYA1_FULL_41_12]OGK66882.1 MAG: GDP-fucose synthetase [Candidatus Roizmanbacteria bacterium RIFOXYB1_FULL_41_27]OGK70744.1 MAG: GDP-fucose synthetase [Candidatus Roizmanbacteria bacterium RIFOXYC1_FULL_41_16]OGK71463.1 MAG: GDP-fucose synthetase [Candidatus Roizmanbacteria bacterium RIFOXYB2_FULL_41_10]OGK75676.1 MAG: GDP-fucose synthetase [Candidatus Roizmanbacteria bacterium RIFOXYD1_FULL_41_24]OGK76336.1 MAG: GDP-fucose
MLNLKKARILVTGAQGFVGKHLIKQLLDSGIARANIISYPHSRYDLKDYATCLKATKNIDLVFHLAANVGGIYYHTLCPGNLFYDNLIMGANLIEASRINKVTKFVSLGTACSYPERTPVPFKEKNFWNGYPEANNAPYAMAKKALLVMLQAYRKQYHFNGIYLIPVNIYGPGDNFDRENSHVIAALIRRTVEAKQKNLAYLEVWGKPTVTRDFIYVDDAVAAIIQAAIKINHSLPINISSGKEFTIKQVVEIIVRTVGYQGKVVWNKKMPTGQTRRTLSTSKARKELSFRAQTSLRQGLSQTVNWYLKQNK